MAQSGQPRERRLPTRLTIVRATLRLLYRSHPRAFTISAVASLAEPLFYPAFVLLLQQLLLQLTGPQGISRLNAEAPILGIAIVVVFMVQRLGIIVRDASATILRQQAWVDISERIMGKLPSVPYSMFENNAFQARYGLVIREASHRSITLVDSLLSTLPILFGLVALAITLFVIAPLMVLILLVIAIPATLVERRFSNAMYDLQEHNAPGRLRMEALTNMQVDAPWQRDVRVYRSDLLRREYIRLAKSYLTQLKHLTARFLGLRSVAAMTQVVGMALAFAAAFVLLSNGQLNPINLAVLIPGIPLLSGMISSFIYQYRSLLESLVYAQTLFDFLTTESFDGVGDDASHLDDTDQISPSEGSSVHDASYAASAERGWGSSNGSGRDNGYDGSNNSHAFDGPSYSDDLDVDRVAEVFAPISITPSTPPVTASLPATWNTSAGETGPDQALPLVAIRLEEVSYTYPETHKTALQGISCTLTRGMTAIVGTNGAGKTTLVKLIAGLVPTTSGALYGVGPGGEELQLASRVKAVLFQDPGHFPFSIRHNVTMRFDREPGEDERIGHALSQAGLSGAVAELPEGIDTVVGAGFGGVADLSGGQWQRLAFARLLYHNAPLIILDEPSASLDPVGEREIFALLSTLARERLVIFTSHRYDTIRKADRIAVLVDGRLAEMGTHEELERKAGAFWSLYMGQGTLPR